MPRTRAPVGREYVPPIGRVARGPETETSPIGESAESSAPPRGDRLRLVEFEEVARCNSRLEAEAIGHALDQYDIPFLVQSADVGMFGPGMTGWSPEGARLLVPADRVEEVRELLTCLKPLEEGQEPPTTE